MESAFVLRVKRRRGSDPGADVLLLDHAIVAPPKRSQGDPAAALAALTLAPPPPPAPLLFERFARGVRGAEERPSAAALFALPRDARVGKVVAAGGPGGVAGEAHAARAKRQRALGGGGGGVKAGEGEEGGADGDGGASHGMVVAGVSVRVFDVLGGGGGGGGGDVVLQRRWLGARDESGAAARVAFRPLTSADATRCMSPLERRLDEAVWRAFRFGDFPAVEAALALCAGFPGSSGVNFQRPHADLTTALMAAAHAGAAGAARELVARGALVRVRDAVGRTAVAYARAAGHAQLADLLRDVLREEARELRCAADEEGGGGDDGERDAAARTAAGAEVDAAADEAAVAAAAGGAPRAAEEEGGEGALFDYYLLRGAAVVAQGGAEVEAGSAGRLSGAGGAAAEGMAEGAEEVRAAPPPTVLHLRSREMVLLGSAGGDDGLGEGWDYVVEGLQEDVGAWDSADEEGDEDGKEVDYPDEDEEEEGEGGSSPSAGSGGCSSDGSSSSSGSRRRRSAWGDGWRSWAARGADSDTEHESGPD
jgi:hypothetical protein